MAKDKTLDQTIDELMKGYRRAIIKAAEYASEKTTKYLYDCSLTCLVEYYNSYTLATQEPKSYERTYRLKDAFVPFTRHSYVGKGQIKCSMGIAYDYNRISGYYEGSENHQPTDSDWIIDNYLDGIHPTTNGARDPLKVKYIPIKDYAYPSVKMSVYLEMGKDKFEYYMMDSFFKQILKS